MDLPPIDLERARRETPGCAQVTHLNNAGSALPSQPVVDAVVAYLQREAAIGGYEAEAEAQPVLEGVYDSAARLLRCHRDEIAVVENATRAWDMVFYAIPFQPGDRILTSIAEYASNYIALLQAARRYGVSVEAVPNDADGQLSVAALSAMMDERVRLIAMTHVPTNGGLVNPAAEVGRVARAWDALYLLDACQSVGQLPVYVDEIGCDMLSTTSRKYLRGPRGMGLLYVRRERIAQLEPPLLDLHAAEWVAPDRYTIRPDARRFENWETSCANKIGLGVAIDYALGWGIERIWERVAALAARLRAQLRDLPRVTLHDQGRVQCGIVSLSVAGLEAAAVQRALAAERINTTVSTVTSTRLDMEARGLTSVLRASVHYYNSEAEIDQLVATLARL